MKRAAVSLTKGLLVAIVPPERVHSLREAMLAFDNVMIVAAAEDGSIPWRDSFFTRIGAPDGYLPAAELRRVLAESGG